MQERIDIWHLKLSWGNSRIPSPLTAGVWGASGTSSALVIPSTYHHQALSSISWLESSTIHMTPTISLPELRLMVCSTFLCCSYFVTLLHHLNFHSCFRSYLFFRSLLNNILQDFLMICQHSSMDSSTEMPRVASHLRLSFLMMRLRRKQHPSASLSSDSVFY